MIVVIRVESRSLKLLDKSNKKSLLLDLFHCHLPPMFQPNSRIFEPLFVSLRVSGFFLGTVIQNRFDNPIQLNQETKTLFIFSQSLKLFTSLGVRHNIISSHFLLFPHIHVKLYPK